MSFKLKSKKTYVIGPDGVPLTVADLPKNDETRWVVRRKAMVVAAVCGGLITVNEACAKYRLTLEEFISWKELADKHGLAGLRATKVKKYRTNKNVNL